MNAAHPELAVAYVRLEVLVRPASGARPVRNAASEQQRQVGSNEVGEHVPEVLAHGWHVLLHRRHDHLHLTEARPGVVGPTQALCEAHGQALLVYMLKPRRTESRHGLL